MSDDVWPDPFALLGSGEDRGEGSVFGACHDAGEPRGLRPDPQQPHDVCDHMRVYLE